jgi:mono/diheme cytochrome c family protein
MRREKLAWIAAASAAGLALIAVSCATGGGHAIQDGTPVRDAVGHVVSLDQGWSEEDQQRFWFTDQGSELMPYEWFLALEQPGSTALFRSDENMARLRYLPARPSRWNPDGLAVGLARSTDETTGRHYVGIVCAACHTAQVEYHGTGLRIDGGPTMSDPLLFFSETAAAMRATAGDDAKFDRFARKVLAQGYGERAAADLRRELTGATGSLEEWVRRDSQNPPPYGFGRWDAFGTLLNQLLAADLEMPENLRPATGPVSLPFLWDTHQADRVQWNGAGFNAGIGSLARNVGEVLGSFGTITIEPHAPPRGYPSSTKIPALSQLEELVGRLESPLWPMQYLPPLDPLKAARGKALYQAGCARCHALIDRTDPHRKVTAVMIPVEEVGTDPTMADNYAGRTAKTGRLQGTSRFVLLGPAFGPEATPTEIVENLTIGVLVTHPIQALEAGVKDFAAVKLNGNFNVRSYKARPLDGIWATAPYLHNGSVPNLWEVLQPPDRRSKVFYVGSREFDPVRVGFDPSPSAGGFKYDTSVVGNAATGHTYGTQLTADEKWDLIEYLKSL